MVLYTSLRIIYEYEMEKGQGLINDFFQAYSIYVIPVVNMDGFYEISKNWNETKVLEMVRKNLKGKYVKCPTKGDEKGVDLNRNYDLAFGMNEEGSSSNPCADDYRGIKAFSEPAT